MQFPARLTLTLSLFFCAALCALAQSAQTNPNTGTGTITGRVTIGDKPANGIAVVLMSSNNFYPERKAAAQAKTDADGQFRLTNVAAGRYEVMTAAPGFVMPRGSTRGFRNLGKTVNLAEGETIEKIDFALVRGGVITGRITDADGRPVIGENVRLASAEQSNERGGPVFFNPFLYQTDDRGIYRIYGIAPGRYTVSVGEDGKSGMVRMGFGRSVFYTRTFHPGVTDETKATVIEVAEGSETTNADITLGRSSQTFVASGRVVDAESGKPVTNVGVGYGSLLEDGKRMGAFGIGSRTDADGRFRFEGLLPGRYAAFVATGDNESETYSVPVKFEISEGDVTGLVVKVRRGASISGVAVIEGTNDRAVLAKLAQLRLAAYPETETLSVPVFGQGNRINADGSFRISGLSPGKFRIFLGGWPPLKGFSLLRVEREGVEQRAGVIEIPAGGEISGLRLVLEYGSGIVRGHVRVENGTLPEGARMYLAARRPSHSEMSLPGVEVDARGNFVLEGLPTGQYQLRLRVQLGPNGPPIPPVTQSVNVVNGTETEVTLVLDLSAKVETGKP
jgi:protocatechuate 3,4-dioxygenase beta subunit